MDATRPRMVPARRIAAIVSLARVTRTQRVLVLCRSNGVARQWRRGVKQAGGRPKNLRIIVVPGLSEEMVRSW